MSFLYNFRLSIQDTLGRNDFNLRATVIRNREQVLLIVYDTDWK
jgi:hypothetical protein